MKNLQFIGMVAAIIALSAFTVGNSISWKVAEGHSIAFSSKDPSGVFTELNGDIVFDPADLSSASFDMSIPVSSINTGNGMKNKHAVGKKWFEADLYPNITFKSESFSKTDTGYEVTGTLQLHGISKEYTLPFTFENNTFKSSFSVNRTDFNLGATKGMSGKVPLELAMDLVVPVTQ